MLERDSLELELEEVVLTLETELTSESELWPLLEPESDSDPEPALDPEGLEVDGDLYSQGY